MREMFISRPRNGPASQTAWQDPETEWVTDGR